MELIIREMKPADFEAVAALTTQLGYESSVDDIDRRFDLIDANTDHKIFVAETGGHVVGYAHLYRQLSLGVDPKMQLAALVVDESKRGSGIGKTLMAKAEEWTIACGLTQLRLSSRIHRTDAHEFYKKLGYEISKQSYFFAKKLSVT